MKRFLAAVFLVLCFASYAEAQSVGDRGQVQTTTGQAVAGAQVTVCAYNAAFYNSAGQYTGAIPCTPALPIFYDPGLAFPIGQLFSDGQGNFFFYVATSVTNQFTITITAPGRIQPYGYSKILGGAGGGGAGNPAAPGAAVQFANAPVTAFATTGCSSSSIGIDSLTSPTVLIDPCSLAVGGPRPYIDVTAPQYGAKGDGSTDDSAAIQAAINAACALNSSSTGIPQLLFPPGRYGIQQPQTPSTASPLNVPCEIHFLGTGGTTPQFSTRPLASLFAITGGSPNAAALMNLASGTSATIIGVTIEGMLIDGYNQAVHIYQGGNIQVQDSFLRAQVTGQADNSPLVEENTLWFFMNGGGLEFNNATPSTYKNLYMAEILGTTDAIGSVSYLQFFTNLTGAGGGFLYDQRAAASQGEPNQFHFNNVTYENAGSGGGNSIFTVTSTGAFPITLTAVDFEHTQVEDLVAANQSVFNFNVAGGTASGITVRQSGGTPYAIQQTAGTVEGFQVNGCNSNCGNIAVDVNGNPLGGGYDQNLNGLDLVTKTADLQRFNTNFLNPATALLDGPPIRLFPDGANSFATVALDPTGALFGTGSSNGWTGRIAQTTQNALDFSFSTMLPPTAPTATPISGGTLANGTYYYFISPSVGGGSCVASVVGAPSLPASATTTTGNNQVTVSWTLPATAPATLTGFCVFRNTSNTFFGAQTGISVAGSGSTSVTDTGSNFSTVGSGYEYNQMQTFHRITPFSLDINGRINSHADTGTANAIVITTPLIMTSIPNGTPMNILVANNNTGATTINLDGIGPTAATKNNGAALASGDLCANHQYSFIFNGSTWDLTSPSCTAPISGVSSFTGDGTVLSNSGSTGAVTATLATQSAHTVLAGPSSGSAAAPTFQTAPTIAVTNMTGTGAFNTSGNAGTATSAATLGACLEANPGDICYYTGSAWAVLTGNASGTQYLQETSSGVPSWTVPSGAGTVTHTAGALTSGQPVLGNGTADVKVGPINLAGGSSFVTGGLPNANLANPATTVNGQTCTLGSTCTIPFQNNGSGASSQAGINLVTSTANTIGITVTPVNSSGIVEKEEATGLVNSTGGGTGISAPTAHQVPVAEGASAFNFVTPSTSGLCFLSNGTSTDPSFQNCPGLTNPMTTLGDVIYGGSSGIPTRLAGPTGPNGVTQFVTDTPSAGAATAEVFSLAGIVPRANTATTDTIVATDRAGLVTESNASPVAVSIAQSNTTGFTSNYVMGIQDIAAGAVTVTPATSTIDGGATLVINEADSCTILSDNTNYFSRCASAPLVAGTNITLTRSPHSITIASTAGGGTVTSIATTSPITGGTITTTGTIACATCVVATVNPSAGLLRVAGSTQTATGAELSGDATTSGSNAVTVSKINGTSFSGTNGDVVSFGAANTPSDTGFLATNVVRKDTTNTGAAAMTLDMSNSTTANSLKIPSQAGLTSNGTSSIAYDTTNKNLHIPINGADGLGVGEASAVVANTVLKATNSTQSLATASSIIDNATTVTTTDTGGYVAPTFTANGTTAGFIDFPQGSTSAAVAPCNVATSRCVQAPSAMTASVETLDGGESQGARFTTGSTSAFQDMSSGDANHSATVTTGSGTSIGSTSLCSTANCPAGTYRLNAYIDITTACGTTGTYTVSVVYTDDQGSKTFVLPLTGTGSVPATGVLTTTSTSNWGEASIVLRSTGAASINYLTTATACGSAGPMVGKLYLSVEAVQ